MQRPILLIGANGQVGQELQLALLPLGDIVTTVRAVTSGNAPASSISLDLTDTDQLRRVIRDHQPRVIVNAAAYTSVDRAEGDAQLAAAVNATAPGVLAEEAARIDAALVHYSTDYVFDGSGATPWLEEDQPAPLNVYGLTKLAGEEAIRRADCAHLILRISWIHSPHGANFVKSILRRAGQPGDLLVVSDQVGAPTSARRIAGVTAQLLHMAGMDAAPFLQRSGGTFHLCAAGEASWHAVAKEVLRLAQRGGWPLCVGQVVPITTAEYSSAARRPLNSRLDCGRLRDRFGISLPDWHTDLADSIDDIIAAIQAAE